MRLVAAGVMLADERAYDAPELADEFTHATYLHLSMRIRAELVGSVPNGAADPIKVPSIGIEPRFSRVGALHCSLLRYPSHE